MTIQIPNVGTGVPADQTGDSPWLAMKKVADNFSNASHAANRLVGTAAYNVMAVGAFGVGVGVSHSDPIFTYRAGFQGFLPTVNNLPAPAQGITFGYDGGVSQIVTLAGVTQNRLLFRASAVTQAAGWSEVWSTQNATRDPNGFLKAASPIAEIYSEKMDLNDDAENQGNITFEKLGVGDYLVKGSLGFAQEGWYIETPKDANGNVLVAVVYEQLSNNDLSIKTYAKKFDDETGDIVANLLKPRDIPSGRFISLRLHELPKPSPVMPPEPPTEV